MTPNQPFTFVVQCFLLYSHVIISISAFRTGTPLATHIMRVVVFNSEPYGWHSNKFQISSTAGTEMFLRKLSMNVTATLLVIQHAVRPREPLHSIRISGVLSLILSRSKVILSTFRTYFDTI